MTSCNPLTKTKLFSWFYLSAAFDTIDHGIFLDRIETRFGITGTAKSWYTCMSYLNEHHTRVSIGNAQSVEHVLRFSVPQGSVLGPQCLTMYTHPVGSIIREHNVSFHVYADDIQLYTESHPKVAGDSNRALTNLSTCISKISTPRNTDVYTCHPTFVTATSGVLTRLPAKLSKNGMRVSTLSDRRSKKKLRVYTASEAKGLKEPLWYRRF